MAKNDDDIAPTTGAEPKKMTRAELRELMFSPEKIVAHRVPLNFNGVDLEWQRPSIQEIQEAQDSGSERNFVVALLISYSYVPGSEEKVFEDGDYATIMQMPYSEEYGSTVQTIIKSLNLKVDEKVKN